MLHLLRTHPFVLGEVDRALARLPASVSAEAREAMREVLLDALTEDPVLVELVRALMPVEVRAESDEREVGGGDGVSGSSSSGQAGADRSPARGGRAG